MGSDGHIPQDRTYSCSWHRIPHAHCSLLSLYRHSVCIILIFQSHSFCLYTYELLLEGKKKSRKEGGEEEYRAM